jgi:hypothetical protein
MTTPFAAAGKDKIDAYTRGHNPKQLSAGIVCFVGLSGKPGKNGPLEPLAETTLSGKIVSTVEMKLRSTSRCSLFFRDNLVQKPPLRRGKLRYPTPREMISEWKAFELRQAKSESNVIILLGSLVADFFKSKREIRMVECPFADGRLLKWAGVDSKGMIVLAVAHPSYVGIYARKRIADYAEMIFLSLHNLLNGENLEKLRNAPLDVI